MNYETGSVEDAPESATLDSAGATVLVIHPSVELYGADRMLLESVAALTEAGWRIVVVVPGEGPLVPLLEATGVRVIRVNSPVLRKAFLTPRGFLTLARSSARALPAVWRVLGQSGVSAVYVSTLTVPMWLVLARARRLPVVCHVHEAEEAASVWVRRALALPLFLADQVVMNSEASRQVVVDDLPRLRNRSRVVYNGVAGPEVAVPPRSTLSDPVRLVLVGRVSPRKGTDVAVDALGLLVAAGRDVTLDIVGGVFPGYEWFEEQVREQVTTAGLGARVRWRGVLSDPWGSLSAADVALIPSRAEPFGNTAVEAMLALRPLVVSATQGLREIVDPGSDGETAVPGDPRSLAAGIERLLDDWPRACARARVAAERAATRFSLGRYRAELNEVITEVVAARRVS